MNNRLDFITKQKKVIKSGFMIGRMFMPENGKCDYCGFDIIEKELSKGNDGSKSLVTGCDNCHRSYCE